LPSSTTYSIIQDNQGFIWIATDAGLVRYDGTNFKVYTTADGLPDNEVLGLHFDPKTNRIWVITYCKKACYYRNNKFFTADNDSSLSIIKCDIGEFINGNDQKNVGEFLYNGRSIYECSNNKVLKTIIQGPSVLQVKKWNDSIYDVLTDTGLIEYRNGFIKNAYSYCKGNEKCKWIDSLMVRCDIGKILFYDKTITGEYKLRRKEVELGVNKSASGFILSKDKYIISIWGTGLYSLDTNLRSPLKKLWSGNLNGFYEDREGNIWIMTIDDGVYLFKKQNVINYSSENGLKHDNLTALAYYADRLYIGNTNGEIYYVEKNKIAQLDIGYGQSLEKIRGIVPAKNKLFLISNSKILSFNFNTKRSYQIPEQSGGPKSILKLADDKTILIGLIGTMISYEIESGAYNEAQTFKRIIAMSQHPDGTTYFGSLDGLFIYRNGKFTHVDSNDTRLQSRITSLCFTPDSLLWIGTPSSGIIIYNGKKIIGHITTSNYLSYRGALCRKIIAGRPNEVWVATNSGIDKIRYHLHDTLLIDNITPLNMADGLLSDDVNDVLVNDSLIYIATSHGLTILNENDLSKPSSAPIYISSLKVNEVDSLVHDETYELTYRQNNLQIEYIGVSLQSSGYISYQYRLLGSSDEWQITNRTSIDLRSLSPGHYTFEVTVLDKFGNRSKHVARVRFNIAPAFYRTIWFWSLIFFSILGIGFYIIRSVFRRRQLAYEKEQSYTTKIIDLEQQALKAQMNPHFIFNCLTAIQHFVNKEDVYSANMYLSNFAKLIRKTLDLSGEQYITLDKEIAYLENYIQLEKMRFQEKFNYFINVTEEVDVHTVLIPPMLLQPIIENAIRHGLRYKDDNKGVLNIDFNMEDNRLLCRIDDNGIGIKKSTELKSNTHVEYQSKGMKLTEARINAINMISQKKISMEVKDKYDHMGSAIGTLVLIYFEQ